jgi:iron complex transport system substrate-binding protein
VCAVAEADVARAVAHLGADEAAALVSLTATTLDGIFADIRRVAAALGAGSKGAVLVGGLKSRVSAISERARIAEAQRAAGAPNAASRGVSHGDTGRRPRVACIEWLDPPMAAGNWIPELVELVGADAVLSRSGAHAPQIEWRDLTAADPDFIVLMPCGFDMERTAAELDALVKREQWRALRAVREDRVYVTDANQYFNRPGPRIVDSLEILAEIVRPDAFSFGHEGKGWRRAGQSNA